VLVVEVELLVVLHPARAVMVLEVMLVLLVLRHVLRRLGKREPRERRWLARGSLDGGARHSLFTGQPIVGVVAVPPLSVIVVVVASWVDDDFVPLVLAASALTAA
jgi:chorismate synthase